MAELLLTKAFNLIICTFFHEFEVFCRLSVGVFNSCKTLLFGDLIYCHIFMISK